jgi:hypothetical protein
VEETEQAVIYVLTDGDLLVHMAESVSASMSLFDTMPAPIEGDAPGFQSGSAPLSFISPATTTAMAA